MLRASLPGSAITLIAAIVLLAGCGKDRPKFAGCDVTTFLDQSADSSSELKRIAERLRVRGLEHVEVVDRENAYVEYRELFGETPELEDVLTKDEVPVSVRGHAADRAAGRRIRNEMADVADVRQTTVACADGLGADQ
jgi:hypothetical protein